MGKIELAFDHITDTKEISELSVVLYADSFFYGLWGSENNLLKTGYHPLYNIDSVSAIWDYYYDLTSSNVMSAQLPFAHLPSELYEESDFNLYFNGLYNLDRIHNKSPQSDVLAYEEVTTLHYLENKTLELIKDMSHTSVAHISTAMANHLSDANSDLICHIANHKLHVTVQDENGFRFYNQFHCSYESDYFYYLMLVVDKFGFDRHNQALKIGGDIQELSSLFQQIKSHFHLTELLPQVINFRQPKISSNRYCDLYLCKTCV